MSSPTRNNIFLLTKQIGNCIIQSMVGTLWYGKEMKYKISPIDSLNEKPLYKQLEEQLAKYIAAHFPGDKLPAEREIAEKAGVNRETVRKAISAFIKKN
jgi:hypothetical protein